MTRPARPARAAQRPATAPKAAVHVDDLWGYLAGDLPAARARAAARHVLTCPACQTRARRLRAMLDACRTAGCQQLPADVRARAKARVKALLRG
jgi:anti-sigma factor RsiW